MRIKNGLCFTENFTFEKRDLYTKGGRIVPPFRTDEEIDAEGLYVLPGLVDVHSHGADGCDAEDGLTESFETILRYEKSQGVTTYCPTLISLPEDRILKSLRALKNIDSDDPELSYVPGIHLEGPFINPSKKGAHLLEYLKLPDADMFGRILDEASGRIRLVTIAPELPGAAELIRDYKDCVRFTFGHTEADYEVYKAGFENGVDHVTHLYNAMPAFLHRTPGIIGAASENPKVFAELIADGIHVHESAIRATFNLFPGRVILVSDSMRAAGKADGSYDFGGQKVSVRGSLATLEDGTIAGSVTNLFCCMQNAIRFGVPETEAVKAATYNPAKSIGIEHEAGTFFYGARADVLLVDKDWTLRKVITG